MPQVTDEEAMEIQARIEEASQSAPRQPRANDHQVAGIHYKSKAIQPWDAIIAWNLGFLDGNVIRYVARWRECKGIEDLKKARHYIDKLIEVEESRKASEQESST